MTIFSVGQVCSDHDASYNLVLCNHTFPLPLLACILSAMPQLKDTPAVGSTGIVSNK